MTAWTETNTNASVLPAATQVVHIGAAGNRDHRRLGMHRIGQAWIALAKPGVVYMHTPGCSVMRLRVGHMHCRLLMARVDDAKILILIRHDIQDRQNMIAGQAEDILNAFELERFCRLNDFP